MKRLLSLILAITMIAAFIPAVSAAGEEATPQNFTIKYDLATPMTTLDVSGNKVTDTFADVFSEENTNGFYTFLSANRGDGDTGTNINWLAYQQNKWIRITAREGEANGDKDEGNISFNLNVPVSGTYTMSANVNKTMNGVTQIKYSKDKGVTWTDFGTLTGDSTTADYDVMNGEEKASVYIEANSDFAIGFFGTNDNVHSSFGDFYLKSGGGSGFAIVNGKINAPETVKIGNPVTITASGYNSKTTEEITSWTYSTEDTGVVTVNAETGLVEAVAPGTATITASAGAVHVLTTTITVSDPNANTIKYDIKTPMTTLDVSGNKVTDTFADVFSEENTNGFYTYLSASRGDGDTGTNVNWLSYEQNEWIRITGRGGLANNDKDEGNISFNLTVPVSGTYTMSANVNKNMNGVTQIKYSKDKGATWTDFGTLTGGSTTADYDVMNGEKKASVYIEANSDFAIGFFGTNDWAHSSFGNFYLKSGDGSGFAIVNGKIDAPETVKIGSPVTITASGYNSKTTEAITSWTYSTEDTGVVTVNAETGLVEAVAPGTATITASAGAVNVLTTTMTVPEKDEVVSGSVSFGAYCDVPDAITVTGINDYTPGSQITSVATGTPITATAKTVEGYDFLGWKRGSADNGVWLTTEATVSFPLMTHTFITAVYEPESEGDTVDVEFYNYKGQHLKTVTNIGDSTFGRLEKPTPTLTGYTTYFWTLDGINEIADNEIFTKLTRVVAKFNDDGREEVSITIGNGITGHSGGKVAYDTKLSLNSASGNAGTWYVNKKPVAYGNSYDHFVWDEATITFEEKETSAPIISLDAKVKSNGARMISYDANGVEIVEVGILFGNNANIGSFSDGKAASKETGDKCGQFTAYPNSGSGEVARGYLIYNDNGTYRVIYTD